MTNIASALKAEITRLSRKELRKETSALKKSVATYRSDIRDLKRRVQSLEQELKRIGKQHARIAPPATEAPESTANLRFRAAGFASLRQRLALSAEQMGLLVGASSQSVYNWEQGKAKPRPSHLPAIAALRSLGKKEVATRIAQLQTS